MARCGSEEFVFLEFTDPEINALLGGLRREFMGRSTSTNIHITVRGPYSSQITDEMIAGFSSTLKEDDIVIADVGMFDNSGECVVYLKVHSAKLRSIWWKPDYPGYNPHISMYIGPDRTLAQNVKTFLERERISLLCSQFRLTAYVSKQKDLQMFDEATPERHFLKLISKGKVRADILQRAANVVKYGVPVRKGLSN